MFVCFPKFDCWKLIRVNKSTIQCDYSKRKRKKRKKHGKGVPDNQNGSFGNQTDFSQKKKKKT